MLSAFLKAAGLIGPKAWRALKLLGLMIAANPELMGGAVTREATAQARLGACLETIGSAIPRRMV